MSPPGTIVCDCCDATYHLECLRPPLHEVPRTEWFCPACVSPGARGQGGVTLARPPPEGGFGCWSRWSRTEEGVGGGGKAGVRVGGGGEPPLLSGSGGGGSLESGGGEGGMGIGGMGDWGPSAGVPKALDWSLSRQTRKCLEVRERERRMAMICWLLLLRRRSVWYSSIIVQWCFFFVFSFWVELYFLALLFSLLCVAYDNVFFYRGTGLSIYPSMASLMRATDLWCPLSSRRHNRFV